MLKKPFKHSSSLNHDDLCPILQKSLHSLKPAKESGK